MSWPTSWRGEMSGETAAAASAGAARAGYLAGARAFSTAAGRQSLYKLVPYVGTATVIVTTAWWVYKNRELIENITRGGRGGLLSLGGSKAGGWGLDRTLCNGASDWWSYKGSSVASGAGSCPQNQILGAEDHTPPGNFVLEASFQHVLFGSNRYRVDRQWKATHGAAIWYGRPAWVVEDIVDRRFRRTHPMVMPIAGTATPPRPWARPFAPPVAPVLPEDSTSGYGPRTVPTARPWNPTWTWTRPGDKAKPGARPDVRSKVQPYDREIKLRMSKGVGKLVMLFNEFTEYADFIRGLYDAIDSPVCKAEAKHQGGGQSTHFTRTTAILNCWQTIDWKKALFNVAWNTVEDEVWARLGLPTKEARQNYGQNAPVNIALGKAMGDQLSESLKATEAMAKLGFEQLLNDLENGLDLGTTHYGSTFQGGKGGTGGFGSF